MLAHFMLFSEADIEYRFLMATNTMVKDEALNPLVDTNESGFKRVTARFHKIGLHVVNAKNRKNKK